MLGIRYCLRGGCRVPLKEGARSMMVRLIEFGYVFFFLGSSLTMTECSWGEHGGAQESCYTGFHGSCWYVTQLNIERTQTFTLFEHGGQVVPSQHRPWHWVKATLYGRSF